MDLFHLTNQLFRTKADIFDLLFAYKYVYGFYISVNVLWPYGKKIIWRTQLTHLNCNSINNSIKS